MTKIADILQGFIPIPANANLEITGLSLNSRNLKPGDLFIAIQGSQTDGRQFIADAIARGAVAVITEDMHELRFHEGVPIIAYPYVKKNLSLIASAFFQEPTNHLKLVGITGTNGKTSCAHFIATALTKLHVLSGVIGTIGSGLIGKVTPSELTTPDAISLQKLFADLVQQQAKVVAMEVSSHSLDQGRVADLPFTVAVFTNLTRDHLDYHLTMDAYGAAKKRLFDNPNTQYAVINADDSFGLQMIHDLAKRDNIVAYSIKEQFLPVPTVYAANVQINHVGLSAEIISPWGNGVLNTSLIGRFNLSNLLTAFTTLCLLDIPVQDALTALSAIQPISGRMQTVGGGSQPLVVVDYSHTPDALDKALSALREHCHGELYCVFGCGGDRDRGKRPLMAQAVETHADHIIVTDDNPRHESPMQIVADILPGFNHPQKVTVEHDRATAIRDVILKAKAGDCILVAGKGAEDYQQIGDVKTPFNDMQHVVKSLSQYEIV